MVVVAVAHEVSPIDVAAMDVQVACIVPVIRPAWIVVTIMPFFCWLIWKKLKLFEYKCRMASNQPHVCWMVRSSLVDGAAVSREMKLICDHLQAKTGADWLRLYQEDTTFPKGAPVFLCTQGSPIRTGTGKWPIAHPLGNILALTRLGENLPDIGEQRGNVCIKRLSDAQANALTEFYVRHCVSAGISTGTVLHDQKPNIEFTL
jgi:hypothetical protein